MPMHNSGLRIFKVFGERAIEDHFKHIAISIQFRINEEKENYVLNVNEIEYVNHLVSEFMVEPVHLDFDNISISSREELIPAERFPKFDFDVDSGQSYLKDVFILHLPLSGNPALARCGPSIHYTGHFKGYIEDGYLCFEAIDFYGDAERIRQEWQEVKTKLKSQYQQYCQTIEKYNSSLRGNIEGIFRTRKQKILDRHGRLASIGVPIKKKEDIPQTYSIPTPQTRKRIYPKPPVTESGFTPHPTLDLTVYVEILKTLHDVGKMFERLPSTYSGKAEEDLRDHFLLTLEAGFEGSATGETFNKKGKTDILIRYENSNIFIAECKFWPGKKKYVDTITQLLGYLTWRDSKAAVVIFVRNKDFSSVLKTVEEVTPSHSNYLGFVDKHDETWFNYRFHINDDPTREVKVAVLLFHIPSTQSSVSEAIEE